MSLDNIYTKTNSARDNLINAIRTMGVNIAEDATINQCATAILMIPSGGGGETKFYQCAGVDTSTKTWSGYELILEDGKYILSTTLTSGLTYTVFTTPVVGTVYTEDALVKVAYYAQDMPSDGLVFYAPLSTASDTAETGQTLTTDGSVTYQTFEGVPCAYFDGNTQMMMNDGTNIPTGAFARTLSCWCKSVSTETKLWDYIFGYWGSSNSGECFIISIYNGTEFGVDLYNSRTTASSLVPDFTKWNHVLVTFSDSIVRFYLNGSLVQENSDIVINTVFKNITLGAEGSWYFKGYLAACRIYNRVLSQDEIVALYDEFKWITISDTLSLTFNTSEEMTYSIDATDNSGNACSYELVSGTLPEGVAFDASTGTFSGTPTTEGDYEVVVRCYTSAATKNVTITLKISASNLEDEPTPEVPPEDEPTTEIPTEGLVLYSSFNINSENFTMSTDGMGTCETGQSVMGNYYIDPDTYPDMNPPFFTKDGIPCFYSNFDNWYAGITVGNTNVPMGGEAVSLSIWYKDEGSENSTLPLLFSIGDMSSGGDMSSEGNIGLEPYFSTSDNKFYMMYSGENIGYTLPDNFDIKKWHHYVITYATDGTTKIYFDGVLWQTYNTVMKLRDTGVIGIGYSPVILYGNCGWISSLRIYNYTLTDDDVIALKSEFTPTDV